MFYILSFYLFPGSLSILIYKHLEEVIIENSVFVIITEIGPQVMKLSEEDQLNIRNDGVLRTIGISLDNYEAPVIKIEIANSTTYEDDKFFEIYALPEDFDNSDMYGVSVIKSLSSKHRVRNKAINNSKNYF